MPDKEDDCTKLSATDILMLALERIQNSLDVKVIVLMDGTGEQNDNLTSLRNMSYLHALGAVVWAQRQLDRQLESVNE
jgi:pyruvate kinase